MSIEKQREHVIASVRKAIKESRVDLTGVTKEAQEELAVEIADRLMVTIDGMLDENLDQGTKVAVESGVEEVLLWQGRPFLSMVERYVLTSERLKIVGGLLSRDVENFELIRFQDIDYKQGVHERVLGIGDITIQGQDVSDPKIVLRNVRDPEQVYEILRRAWLDSRKRHGLEFREFM
ncbi:MAG: PH domain-containing protein [Anaerolineales bacterium]